MKEYLLLLRGGIPLTSKSEAESKAEMQALGRLYGTAWTKRTIGSGLPLASGGSIVSAKGTVAGPVKSATEGIVGNYLIIKADSLEQACGIAKACPHIANQGNIEVREIAPMPAM